jgi:hypothetical protein
LVDTDVIKYLIEKFEEKIRANPLTPEFVKLANYYLINGNVNEAISLHAVELSQLYYCQLILEVLFANRYFSTKNIEQLLVNIQG